VTFFMAKSVRSPGVAGCRFSFFPLRERETRGEG
jgi:hypothetical protein